MNKNSTWPTGFRIKQFRKRAGLSQMELELRINAAFGSVSRMENGITNPTKETLFAIANALELTSIETASLFGIDLGQEYISSITNQLSDNIYQV